MSYTVRMSRHAIRYFDRLDRVTQERVRRKLREVADDPFGPSSKPLEGFPQDRAARVGGWRILFTIDPAEQLILVQAIGPRGQIYRDL